MITDIEKTSERILEILNRKGGFLNFNQIKLNLPDCLVLMSLGWLCHKGYVKVADESSSGRQRQNDLEYHLRTTLVFSPDSALLGMLRTNTLETSASLKKTIDRLSIILNESNGLMTLKDFQSEVDSSLEIILMAIGYLAKEGRVGVSTGKEDVFVFQLPQPDWAKNSEILARFLQETN